MGDRQGAAGRRWVVRLARSVAAAYLLLAAVFTVIVVVCNLRLYSTSGPDRVPEQLRFIGDELRQGSARRMQSLFPEGYFFSYALYGLAWAELGERMPKDSPTYGEVVREIRWALEHVDSAEGRDVFAPELEPAYGVFYRGWTAWLRGSLLAMHDAGDEQRRRFSEECAAIAAAFDASSTPFLESYPRQSWPCDSVVAVAALCLHDRINAPRYGATVQRWLKAARGRLDPGTGLLPHLAEAASGQPLGSARGTSQSVIQRFMPVIDAGWADEQYKLFRQQFITTRLGLPGVREFATGVDGDGDVDSGPLLFGISASATVVTVGAARVHNDAEVAQRMTQVGEAAGLPIGFGGSKRYAFGLLPLGDAFVAWAQAAHAPAGAKSAADLPPLTAWWWRLPSHGLSLLAVLLAWTPPFAWRVIRRRRSRRDSQIQQTGSHAASRAAPSS